MRIDIKSIFQLWMGCFGVLTFPACIRIWDVKNFGRTGIKSASSLDCASWIWFFRGIFIPEISKFFVSNSDCVWLSYRGLRFVLIAVNYFPLRINFRISPWVVQSFSSLRTLQTNKVSNKWKLLIRIHLKLLECLLVFPRCLIQTTDSKMINN